MAIDPEELVVLTNHGSMKLRSAVARTMILPLKERKRARIVRKGTSAILKFEQIKDLIMEDLSGLCQAAPRSQILTADWSKIDSNRARSASGTLAETIVPPRRTPSA